MHHKQHAEGWQAHEVRAQGEAELVDLVKSSAEVHDAAHERGDREYDDRGEHDRGEQQAQHGAAGLRREPGACGCFRRGPVARREIGPHLRLGIRRLLQQYRDGGGVPFVMEYDGEIAGQLNVWGIARGSLSSATIGYWVGERFAGRDITPTCVALATDVCFRELGLHRMEICIRPENKASLRVVEKLGFRYEGLRRRFIHIAGDWRDHYAFALVREEVPGGVLERWVSGRAPTDAATVPLSDRLPG